jgi:RNA polymerase sigma factor (sigma-70 family)
MGPTSKGFPARYAGDGSTDAELVSASRSGQQAAFGRLIERYQGVVGAVSYAATGDRALGEEVTQETFLAAWQRLGQLREVSSLGGWLCGIARNLGRRARRRGGREIADDEAADPIAPDGTPFDAVATAEAERLVWDALERIPATYREALILFYQEDRSAAEVARALGIGEDAALQRLSRGRRHLADGIGKLVERSLAGRRRPSVKEAVLAALPAAPLAPTHVIPPQGTGVTPMIKLAIGFALLAATGTTAYVVARPGTSATPAASSSVASPAPAAPTARARATPSSPLDRDAAAPTAPSLAPPVREAPPDVVFDAATLERLGVERGPSRGPADAPVTIVVFSDFQCPFCAQVLATVDQLWDDYPGKLRLVSKQLVVHPTAQLAAEAALAAGEQGRYWEMHDALYADLAGPLPAECAEGEAPKPAGAPNASNDLSLDALVGHATRLGLDVAPFRAALESRRLRTAVEADGAVARELEILGTPSFLINGRRFSGAQPVEQFRAAIDDALSAVDPK